MTADHDLAEAVSKTLKSNAETIRSPAAPLPPRRAGSAPTTWRTVGVAAMLAALLLGSAVGAAAIFSTDPAATRVFALVAEPGGADATFVEATVDGRSADISRTKRLNGSTPAIAASADGDTVFLASQTDDVDDDVPSSDVLTVLRQDGTSAQVELFAPGTDIQRLQPLASFRPTITASGDGSYVYVQLFTQGSEGEQGFFLGTVDVVAARLLPELIPMEQCPSWYQVLPLEESRLAVLCPNGPGVTLLSVAEDGSAGERTDVVLDLPDSQASDAFGAPINLNAVAGAVETDPSTLRLVTMGGTLVDVDLASGSTDVVGGIDLPADLVVTLGQVVSTLDGELLVGVRPVSQADMTISTTGIAASKFGIGQSQLVDVGDAGIRSLASVPNNSAVIGITPHGGQLLILDKGTASFRPVDEGLPSGELLYALAVEPKTVTG